MRKMEALTHSVTHPSSQQRTSKDLKEGSDHERGQGLKENHRYLELAGCGEERNWEPWLKLRLHAGCGWDAGGDGAGWRGS